MREITAPGIYYGFDPDAYLADPCPAPSFSQSIAKVLLEKSPAHARLQHPRLAPPIADDDEAEKYIKAQAIGNAAHRLLLGRGKRLAVGEFGSWQSKDAKAFKADAIADGREPILDKHMAQAGSLVIAARRQLAAGDHAAAFGDPERSEVVLAWQEDGLWFRTMIDWMADPRRPYDYKSTALSCAPHIIAERPAELGWDIQAAMHERALDVLDPDNAGRRKFHFVAQENDAPFALTVVEISEHDLTMGRKKLAMAVDIWRGCMTSGQWPAYPAETVLSRPRPWSETKFLEREVEREERQTRQPAKIAADHLMAG